MYASESLALCVFEALVHITGAFPADYGVFRIEVPDRAIERIDPSRLKRSWSDDLGLTRAIGDQWLQQERSSGLLVPSAVVPASSNVLINPLHPDARALRVLADEEFRFDPRLRS